MSSLSGGRSSRDWFRYRSVVVGGCIMLSRALAVALLLALPSVASAQVPVGFGFPNGAPWCAFGFDCRFLNYRECADWIFDPARNCLKNPYFAAHYPTNVDKGWSYNRR